MPFGSAPASEQAGAKRKQRGKTPAPFSLRLTFEERAALAVAAGAEPLGCYIRRRILGDDVTYSRRHRRAPVQDHEALGRVLGALGQSKLASNLNQLAKAVNTGTLEVTPDSEQAIRDACADVQRMRAELLRALGLPAETP
ncbi:hypothetical protein M2352_003686 [Azospirillum fermentarium]|uniref:hypothetical protein n=1 Tax=Azospirillum fermentarium TaxID=1233114 RepID=UPI002227C397|nr:hypothetical protein [Azospirillum fermentarium]MCW2248052.1 hypothetical protein [Azospirillum fermentarium]